MQTETEIDKLISDLDALKYELSEDSYYYAADLVRTACKTIKVLKRRPISEWEIEQARVAKIRKNHADALDAVYRYFKGRVEEGELLDPAKVGEELGKTIRDFGG